MPDTAADTGRRRHVWQNVCTPGMEPPHARRERCLSAPVPDTFCLVQIFLSNFPKNASKKRFPHIYIAMTRYRILFVETTAYMVSSYSSQPGVNLRDKFAHSLLVRTVKRAQKRFNFKRNKLIIKKDHFVLVLTSDVDRGRMLPEIMQWVKSVFAKAWNRHFGLKGAFWSDRYDSEVLVTGMVAEKAPCLALHFAPEIAAYAAHVRRGLLGVTGLARLRRILRQ